MACRKRREGKGKQMTKDDLNEIDVLLHGAQARASDLLRDTDSALLLGEALELERIIGFIQRAQKLVAKELNKPVMQIKPTRIRWPHN